MRPRRAQLLGRSLARLHQVGARGRFERAPAHRCRAPGLAGAPRRCSRATLLPEGLHERYAAVSAALLERVERAPSSAAGAVREIRMHGDCHLGNLLWNEHGPVFVDLDDCAMGPRVQDLWMMLSGSPAEQQRAVGASSSRATSSSRDFDFRELQPHRAAAGAAHAAPRRLGGPPLARPGLSPGLSLVRRGALLGGVPAGPPRADRADRGSAAPAWRLGESAGRVKMPISARAPRLADGLLCGPRMADVLNKDAPRPQDMRTAPAARRHLRCGSRPWRGCGCGSSTTRATAAALRAAAAKPPIPSTRGCARW